ncbi:MAG: hypothetical protein E7048_04705 [Lentisphaerae bacterium]|nr:hypothetical protein [Lentisphaerota bacterium]MBR2872972.1 DUF5309 family protein [Lentisphaeria bacterium]
MLYSYSFSNRKRDLSDILSTVVKEEPRFISNFKNVPDARMRKHEWLEDQMQGRSITASAIASGVLTVGPADAAKVKAGTLLALENTTALFAVTAVGISSVTVELAAANGSGLTVAALPAAGGVFKVISTPMGEGSINGDGEENYAHSNAEYNTTQIFRKEIVLSGSALAVGVYGSADNQLNRQTAFALADLARDLNRVALFGRRVEPAPGVKGEAGGLYAFAAGEDGLCIDADSGTIDSFIINDGAQAVLGAGGEPTQILCSPGQARIISNEYRNNLQILRSDDRRGAYVAVIVNDINGKGMTIMADPDMPDTEAWIIDPEGFGLASLQGRGISDEDATPSGFDGIRRTALGELTFEFRNAKQRCCRIKNLMGSAEALSMLRAD